MNWSDIDRSPSLRKLRQFSAIWLVFFAIVAAMRYWRGHPAVAFAVVAAAGVAGLLLPRAMKPLFVVLTIVTFPIGWVVSRLLLGVAFYAIFTPLAVLFRILRRDVLRLKPSESATFWTPKKQPADKSRYLRQF
jgi:hypothetical protein